MINFKILDERYDPEVVGIIPLFFDERDPRPAAEQADDRYAHGGGWSPMKGWTVGPVGELRYQGDREAMLPIAIATLHDEIIRLYPSAWVTITQPDGTFEVSHMD